MAVVNGGAAFTIEHEEIRKKSSETSGQILKKFHRNVPWVTLFKNYSHNFHLSINMVQVNGRSLHCTDIKEILVNSALKATKIN